MHLIDDLSLFQHYLLDWYTKHGRYNLPWRAEPSPHHVLVSELMLQQTQVERVIPKYESFLNQYPTIQVLAKTPLSEIITSWQGLGYNRRAKYLQITAQELVLNHKGSFPDSLDSLQKLPGIGPYTASAIAAFAFGKPVIMIETNIRAVFLYHFFHGKNNVPDSALVPLIQESLYVPDPATWYAALMDYGSVLKKLVPNPSSKSKMHQKQSKFEGSVRQVRGSVIRELSKKSLTFQELHMSIDGNKRFLPKVLENLIAEKLIARKNGTYTLANPNLSQTLQ